MEVYTFFISITPALDEIVVNAGLEKMALVLESARLISYLLVVLDLTWLCGIPISQLTVELSLIKSTRRFDEL